MDANNGVGSAMAVPAKVPTRPAPHRQFKLLPVVLPRHPEWNARVLRWAVA